MKTTRPGKVRFPNLYRNFDSAEQIARTINRSRSYVFKALNVGFTEREMEMLEGAVNERKND